MPRRTYKTAEEKWMPSRKPIKDKLTLTLCTNVSSKCKIKSLLVYYSDNPRAFKSHKILKEKLQEDKPEGMGHQAVFLWSG